MKKNNPSFIEIFTSDLKKKKILTPDQIADYIIENKLSKEQLTKIIEMYISQKTAGSGDDRNPNSIAIYLLANKLLKGRVLDYGCGHGTDMYYISNFKANISGYDPNFYPEMPKGKFDTIICTFVLNVVRKEREEEIIQSIYEKLKDDGIAYITVLRNVKNKDYDRQLLSEINIIRRRVELNLPVLVEVKNRFITYILSKKKLRAKKKPIIFNSLKDFNNYPIIQEYLEAL